MHRSLLGSVCKFSPGHCIRLERFVQELCTRHLPSCDTANHDALAVATKKRKGTYGATAVRPTPEGRSQITTEDTVTIIGKLRQQITEWQRKTLDENFVRKHTLRIYSKRENCFGEL